MPRSALTELQQINDFIKLSREVADQVQLAGLVGDFASDIGFDYFSLFRHDRRSSGSDGTILVTNYPEAWIERSRALRYYADDPVFAASTRTAVGFLISDVPRMLDLSKRQIRTLDEGRLAGLGDGFSVPAHVPGEANGLCTFIVRTGRTLPLKRLPMAQLAGAFAYEAGRRLKAAAAAKPEEAVRLTERQLECVLLIARGKSDWEIATILGVKEDTITEHVDDARRRYGVARRTQLVVRALVDGHITLQDALA